MRRKDYPTIEENVQALIRMYGAQTFLKHLAPEEIIPNLAIEDIVQNLDKETLLQIMIRQMGFEQFEQLLHKLAQQNDGKDGKKKR